MIPKGFLHKFLQHNWLATFYLNFKMLPVRQAVFLPIDVYRDFRISSLSGSITINSERIWRGMIKIGGRGSDMFTGNKVILDILGGIVFSGQAEIGYGTYIHVSKGAKLIFGDRVRIGANCKIYCDSRIEFENEIDISWESQIFDTNFHDMEDVSTGKKIEMVKPICIGSYNWFGNRCNIMKGTNTLPHTIVASNSMTNKNYTIGGVQYSILAGTPAKIVKTGVRRIFEGVNDI